MRLCGGVCFFVFFRPNPRNPWTTTPGQPLAPARFPVSMFPVGSVGPNSDQADRPLWRPARRHGFRDQAGKRQFNRACRLRPAEGRVPLYMIHAAIRRCLFFRPNSRNPWAASGPGSIPRLDVPCGLCGAKPRPGRQASLWVRPPARLPARRHGFRDQAGKRRFNRSLPAYRRPIFGPNGPIGLIPARALSILANPRNP